MTPRNPPTAGLACSMTFGQLRHGPQCWPGGSVPGRGPASCELATRLREAVESHACYSLVSAPTDHSTVVTTATVIGTAVTRHRPCGTVGETVTRWRPPGVPLLRENFTTASPRPVVAKVVGCSF